MLKTKKIMKKRFLSILILCSCAVFCQQQIVSDGGNAAGSGGSASYSVGQIAYTYATATTGSISQGVQQTVVISTLGIDAFPSIKLEMSVYPNPTNNNATLKIADLTLQNLSYQLFDTTGKQILRKQISNSETSISFENLNAAIYFLQVIASPENSAEAISNKTIKTFKIIKNQ